MAIEQKYLHLCPPDLDFDNITLTELLAVSIGSVKRSNYKGANIAIIGAGTIGNLIAQSMILEVPHLQRKEINLIGHMMYVREDFADAIRFLADGKIYTDGFITQRFNLKDMDKAYEFIDEHPKDIMKVIIDIN